MDRRSFLKYSAFGGSLVLLQLAGVTCMDSGCGLVIQESLPYKADALEPFISEKTVLVHYTKSIMPGM